MLALALTEYESGLCSGCGQQSHESTDISMSGWYEARTFVCHGCAALAEFNDDDKRAKEKGEHVYLVDTSTTDG